VPAARNGVFSGRVVVSSDQLIKGLHTTVSDLSAAGGEKIPASAVRVRCAEPAVPSQSRTTPPRFDGLLETLPAEIPVAANGAFMEGVFRGSGGSLRAAGVFAPDARPDAGA
jgi:hypothetical protein